MFDFNAATVYGDVPFSVDHEPGVNLYPQPVPGGWSAVDADASVMALHGDTVKVGGDKYIVNIESGVVELVLLITSADNSAIGGVEGTTE